MTVDYKELARDVYCNYLLEMIIVLDDEYHRNCLNAQSQFKTYHKHVTFEEIVAHRCHSCYHEDFDLETRQDIAGELLVMFGTHCPLNITYDQTLFVVSVWTGVSLLWIQEMEEKKAQKIKELLAAG